MKALTNLTMHMLTGAIVAFIISAVLFIFAQYDNLLFMMHNQDNIMGAAMYDVLDHKFDRIMWAFCSIGAVIGGLFTEE